MYKPISSLDWPMIVMLPLIIFLCLGISGIWAAIKEKNRNYLIVGAVGFALMMAMFPFVDSAFEKDDRKHEDMVSNILTKYNMNISWPDSPGIKNFTYFKDVKYEGPGGRYESGNYFTLVYADDSVSKVKFYFSDKTGEPKPRCSCDLKSPLDLKPK